MVAWLIPVCLFGLFASIFFGGTTMEPQGGSGLQQVLGLLASCVVHVVLWNLLRIGLDSFLPTVGAIAFASLIMIPGVVLAGHVGFRVLGVKIGKAAPAH